MIELMPLTPFADDSPYSVQVTDEGVTVYSECCGAVMSRSTAERLHAALGVYLMGSA